MSQLRDRMTRMEVMLGNTHATVKAFDAKLQAHMDKEEKQQEAMDKKIVSHGTRLTRIETWGKALGWIFGVLHGAILATLGIHK